MPTCPRQRPCALVLLLGLLLAGCQRTPPDIDAELAARHPILAEHRTRSPEELLVLLDGIGFDQTAWEAAGTPIPRLQLTQIPQRWRDQSQGLPVATKKSLFFRLVCSGVLQANERIAMQRERLLTRIEAGEAANDPWVRDLALAYAVIETPQDPLNAAALARLQRRVDGIPPSLALAQAAEESGWGTSRFAVQGNALFGQWDFSGQGLRPRQQRAELGDYRVASFASPRDSIAAYLHNLNTHPAYAELRRLRAELRAAGQPLDGHHLAAGLSRYSERGEDYVSALRGMIEHNRLQRLDSARLWTRGRLLIIPVEETAADAA